MLESYQFRVDEKLASRLFREDEGKKLSAGLIRLIEIAGDDPRLPGIGAMQRQCRCELNQSFFRGWDINRHYRKSELNAADAFMLWPTRTFEPAGEECGTTYDESVACPDCGAGAAERNGLRLDLRKAPKTADIARTIANEVVVSQELAESLIDCRLTGFELRQACHKARYNDGPLELSEVPTGRRILLKAEEEGVKYPEWEFWVWLNRPENRSLSDQARGEYATYMRKAVRAGRKPLPAWYQLVTTSRVNIVPPTRTGIEPFDDDVKGEYRCPRGDTIGLNLLSELSLSRADFAQAAVDIVETRQYIGVRRGLLRPERRLVISQRFRQVLEKCHAKGYSLEVAHLR